MQITFYTDGSSRGNPGPGGWGVYVEVLKFEIVDNEKQKKLFTTKMSGGEKLTTNNKMELLAGIEALKYLKKNFTKILKNQELKITIKTDSMYMKNGIESWIKNWEKNNWKGSNKKEVMNKEYWQELLELKNFINKKLLEKGFSEIRFEYVKAHVGIIGNEIADTLATEAAYNIQK